VIVPVSRNAFAPSAALLAPPAPMLLLVLVLVLVVVLVVVAAAAVAWSWASSRVELTRPS
jgi:hypothetical protein